MILVAHQLILAANKFHTRDLERTSDGSEFRGFATIPKSE